MIQNISRELGKVLVTGGAGFIGSHVVEQLVQRGCDVIVADNLSSGLMENLSAVSGRYRFKRIDFARDQLAGLFSDNRFDTVIHAAGNAYIPTSVEDPQRDLEDNILSAHRLLAAMREQKSAAAFVNVSSAAVYGEGSGVPMTEEEPTRPVSPYGISKLAAELYVRLYAKLYGLNTCTLRLFSVFGPRLRKQVVWDFMMRLSASPTELVIHGDGSERRDLNYIDNVVAAILLVAEHGGMNGDAFNVAAKETVSIDELARALSGAMGLSPTFSHTGVKRPGDARDWTADITRLQAMGYRSSTNYEAGLKQTVAWFRSLPSQP